MTGRLLAALACSALALSACVQVRDTRGVQPTVAITCRPGQVRLDLRNVDSVPARYTVSVEIARDGLLETEQLSSDVVQPGKQVTLVELRPEEREQCRVTGVQVYPAAG